MGVVYHDETQIEHAQFTEEQVMLQIRREGSPEKIAADLLTDATGQNGFLRKALEIPEEPLEHFPPTEAIYTHFRNVQMLEHLPEFASPGEPFPYPPDDSAVHHILPGGWIWVLRFNNGITSAGASATDEVAKH